MSETAGEEGRGREGGGKASSGGRNSVQPRRLGRIGGKGFPRDLWTVRNLDRFGGGGGGGGGDLEQRG